MSFWELKLDVGIDDISMLDTKDDKETRHEKTSSVCEVPRIKTAHDDDPYLLVRIGTFLQAFF